MAPRLSGQNYKFVKFLLSLNSKRDLNTKKRPPNIEVCPESLGAMLEYWSVERDLLFSVYRKHFQQSRTTDVRGLITVGAFPQDLLTEKPFKPISPE